MEYRKYGDAFYIRMDKGDEIISTILQLCKTEGIQSCTFSGIGGCSRALVQTFNAETGLFESRQLEGTLELISLNGNVITDQEGTYFHHTHALFAYKAGNDHVTAGGHMSSLYVSYTAEIELRPVIAGAIKRKYDPETGTGFWNFSDDGLL